MKFWDSSAIVPLLLAEAATPLVQAVAEQDPGMLVWWATEVECASALARLEREGGIYVTVAADAFERMTQLAGGWYEVEPGDGVREAAVRLLRVHQLRAADALQLAAAVVASEHRPSTLELVTLDEHLAAAARKEGFVVVMGTPRP